MNKNMYISAIKLGENDMFACVSIPNQFLEQILFSSLEKIISGRKKTVIEICNVRLHVLIHPASSLFKRE